MVFRVMRLLAVASLVLTLPVGAQRAGTIEVGGFARYVDFDNTLPMGDDVGVGGRVGVYLESGLAFELDLTRSSQSSVTYTPLHLRLVHNAPLGARLETLVGGGWVHNWYGTPYQADDGLSVLVGLRYHVQHQLWLRLGADLDGMFHTADNSLFTFYNGNWGIHFGASVRLN